MTGFERGVRPMGDWSTSTTSLRNVRRRRASRKVVGDVAAVALAERLQQSAIEDVVDERGFAGAGDAGDAAEQAERDLDVDAVKIVACARL